MPEAEANHPFPEIDMRLVYQKQGTTVNNERERSTPKVLKPHGMLPLRNVPASV
jgi:hypothetical protein